MVPEEVRETVPFVHTACFYCFLISSLCLCLVSPSHFWKSSSGSLSCFKFEEKFLILFEVSKWRAWKSWFSQGFWIIKLCNIQKVLHWKSKCLNIVKPPWWTNPYLLRDFWWYQSNTRDFGLWDLNKIKKHSFLIQFRV